MKKERNATAIDVDRRLRRSSIGLLVTGWSEVAVERRSARVGGRLASLGTTCREVPVVEDLRLVGRPRARVDDAALASVRTVRSADTGPRDVGTDGESTVGGDLSSDLAVGRVEATSREEGSVADGVRVVGCTGNCKSTQSQQWFITGCPHSCSHEYCDPASDPWPVASLLSTFPLTFLQPAGRGSGKGVAREYPLEAAI